VQQQQQRCMSSLHRVARRPRGAAGPHVVCHVAASYRLARCCWVGCKAKQQQTAPCCEPKQHSLQLLLRRRQQLLLGAVGVAVG
jgi:hypothetical protein